MTKAHFARTVAAAAIAAGFSAVIAPAAQAYEASFTLSGVFNGTTDDPLTGMGNPIITDTLDAGLLGANVLTANEKFSITGLFDPTNVVFSIPGFKAYSPDSVTLTVFPSGSSPVTYTLQTYSESATSGFTVAIFDATGGFGPPGHVGAGFLANPPMDGAGLIGDWYASSPAFTLPALVTSDYTTANYFGVGVGSGPCEGPPGPGGSCPAGHAVVPIAVDGGLYDLTLGNYDLNNPANLSIPGPPPGSFLNPNPNAFTAALVTPEPSTWAMMLIGFAGFGVAGLARGRKLRSPA